MKKSSNLITKRTELEETQTNNQKKKKIIKFGLLLRKTNLLWLRLRSKLHYSGLLTQVVLAETPNERESENRL